MQKLLRKRLFRELKANYFRYLALGLLIVLGMYLIVSMVGAAQTIMTGVDQKAEENGLEDGEFGVFVPLTEKEINGLIQSGIAMESMFYQDFEQEDSSVLRLYENRESVNRIDLWEGGLAENASEAVLEKRYCEENGIHVLDAVVIGGKTFQVSGIGTVPDYDAMFRNLSDSSAESKEFGLAFVTKEAYAALRNSGKRIKSEEYVYAYRLNGKMTDEELKEKLRELQFSQEDVNDSYFQEYWKENMGERIELEEDKSNLTQFLKAADNPRIKASADDQVINKMAGLMAGVIVMILFTYVISVFVIHNIEAESSIIGSLYALGVKKRDLMLHYLTLPVLITFFSGMLGAAAGFGRWGIRVMMRNSYGYFSLPDLPTVYPAYLIVYAVVMPSAAAALVNCIVIWNRLSQPALSLIRNTPKSSKASRMRLKHMSFPTAFRIRQMLREARTGCTLIFGMFISLLILLLGINCYVMCRHLGIETREDTKYEYMYTYKYPEKDVPDGGEACYAKTLKKEIYGYHLDVTLLGIGEENPYFEAEVPDSKTQVIVSTAMAQKYGLSVGDDLILSDEEADINYAFRVNGITQYTAGLYVFMDIGNMREMFGQTEEYYNVVFADNSLPIASGRLCAVTTKEEIAKSSEVFITMMMPMVTMLTGVSALIFAVVMYLMMKVMMDRSAFGISLFKIFGYRQNEIRKLYLNGNFYLVAAGAAICIPLAKILIDRLYPLLVSNVACGMNLSFGWQLYFGIYAAVIGVYLIINQMLARRLKKLVPAEVLKNRE